MKHRSNGTQGRMVGYARVSTLDQNLDLQIDALRSAGCPSKLIFTDKVSGSKGNRPGLDACLRELREGDTLIIWRLDRLGRSMVHLINLVVELRDRGVAFRSIMDAGIDTTTASGELMLHMFGALAQFERRRIQERTRAGLEAARARGRKGGRRPITVEHPKVQAAKKLHADKSMPVAEICDTLDISRTTLYRYVEMADHKSKVHALRQALIDGENSGDAGPLDFDTIKRKGRAASLKQH